MAVPSHIRRTPQQLSGRALALPGSLLHEIHARVVDGNRAGVIPLHVGEPGYVPPAGVAAAIQEAHVERRCGYTSAEGLLELREHLAARALRRYGAGGDAARIVATPGSTHALLGIMIATCDPGDEILLPRIHWPLYVQAAALARVRPRFYDLAPDGTVDPERVAAAVGPASRLLVVNSPANPTGTVCPHDTLETLVSLARECGLWFIHDEAYEDFVFGGEHASAVTVERDVPESARCVFGVHSFSKSYAMTGHRLGYLIAPSVAAAAAVRNIQQGTIVAPSTPVQYAGIAALSAAEYLSTVHAFVREGRDVGLAPALERGLLASAPPAGWYAMLDVAHTGLSSVVVAERLLDEVEVCVAPGAAFVPAGTPDPQTVRVAFCGDPATVREGVARICEWVDLEMNRSGGSERFRAPHARGAA